MNTPPVVAVTGATGFLGLHVVVALARAGVRIRILARREPVHEMWRGIDFDVVRGGLESGDAIERLVIGADAIVHAAGLIKARNSAEFLRTNRDGTSAIAAAARRHVPQARFIAISSMAAREPQLSDYAASKRAGEDAARAAYADAMDRLVIVRPPVIYGPWDRETLTVFKAASHRIVPVFGSGRMAMIHVFDAAAAIARLGTGAGSGGLYTLADTNPAGYTMDELLREMARAVGNTPRLLRIPDRALLLAAKASTAWGQLRGNAPIFTTGKAREMLHRDWSVPPDEALPATVYKAGIPISEGFRQTAAWYRSAAWLG
jgi:nucleoside-diphosphate-sugar epimerase